MEAERDPRENPAVELADRLGLPQPGLFATMDEVIEDVRLRLDALTTRLRAAEAVVEAARTLDPFCWDEQESVKDDAFGDVAVEFSDCGQCAPCQVWNLIRSYDTLRETES